MSSIQINTKKAARTSAQKVTQQNIRQLRRLAHKLKPVIMLGKAGYSENVHDELETALSHHELVKIKLNGSDRSVRDDLIKRIITQTNSQLIQKIGQILVIYRQSENKVITFL